MKTMTEALAGFRLAISSPKRIMFRGTRSPFKSVLLAAIVGFCAEAQASLVTITGEFTSFSSAVTPPNSVPDHTFVNGTEILPPPLADGTPFAVPLGPNANAIEFYYVSFGSEQLRNLVEFVPGPAADVVVGQEFLLGTFNLTNGVWFGNASMQLNLVTHSSDPALDGHVFNDALNLQLNPFVFGDPALGADFFYLSQHPVLGSVRVFELFDSPTGTNTGSVQFYGRISSLDPTRFANAQGGVFLSPSIETAPFPNTASEPPPLALLMGGLVLLYGLVRRRGSSPLPHI